MAGMLPHHVFSHQHQYTQPESSSWQQLPQQNHQQQHSHHDRQHTNPHSLPPQTATAAIQQQHYNRIANNNNGTGVQGVSGEHGSILRDGTSGTPGFPSGFGSIPGFGAGSVAEFGSGAAPPGFGVSGFGSGATSANGGGGGALASPDQSMTLEERRILEWIAQLLNPEARESALLELSKKREQFPQLALILWHSFGVMASLLQEIISVYPLLNPSQLTAAASNRVCNALALLQCVASHGETRSLFLSAHIPLFLYPFLNTTSKSRPFEYLRLTSLGVIGALVKNESSDVINFLLTTEIIPLCLRIMETGSELSKTVAIFIVQKILLDDTGLNYICQTYERFYAVGTVLSNMVLQLVEQQTVRLLKHVVRCFLRLSDNARAREALRQCLPEPLRDATFSPVLRDDAATKRCLAQLLINLSDNVVETSNHNLLQ